MPAVVYFKGNLFSLRQYIKTTTCPAPDVWGEAESSKDAVKHQRGVRLSQHMDPLHSAAGVERTTHVQPEDKNVLRKRTLLKINCEYVADPILTHT